MTEKRLSQIRKRCEAATKGEWEYVAGESEDITAYITDKTGFVRSTLVVFVDKEEHDSGGEPSYFVQISEADAEFICNARPDIIALLEYIEKLKSTINQTKKRKGRYELDKNNRTAAAHW